MPVWIAGAGLFEGNRAGWRIEIKLDIATQVQGLWISTAGWKLA